MCSGFEDVWACACVDCDPSLLHVLASLPNWRASAITGPPLLVSYRFYLTFLVYLSCRLGRMKCSDVLYNNRFIKLIHGYSTVPWGTYSQISLLIFQIEILEKLYKLPSYHLFCFLCLSRHLNLTSTFTKCFIIFIWFILNMSSKKNQQNH